MRRLKKATKSDMATCLNKQVVRRKFRVCGDSYNWWLRSPNVTNTNNFRYVNNDGNVNNNNASNSYGVSFGFCDYV